MDKQILFNQVQSDIKDLRGDLDGGLFKDNAEAFKYARDRIDAKLKLLENHENI